MLIFFIFTAWSILIPVLSPISLALSYSFLGIPIFLCFEIIFCYILSLLQLMILWINTRVEYSILSFAGHIPVSIRKSVEGVVTGRCYIFFNDWFCTFSIACISFFDFHLHTSNSCNNTGMRHVSKSLIFTLISSCPTFCFDGIPFISLIILFALLSVFLYVLLNYLLCVALLLSNYMCLFLYFYVFICFSFVNLQMQ